MPDTCILILLDGLGDRSHPQLDQRTPLQAAHTPCLDRLASLGGTGLYHATLFGQPLPSENAHFAIFGGMPEEFPGRGPLEALGAGLDLCPDDVAILAHFAHLEPDSKNRLILRHDKVSADPEEIRQLFDSLEGFECDGVALKLHPTNGMFSVLTMQGDVAPHITDTNPMVDGRFIPKILPLAPYADDPPTRRTARILTEYLKWAHHRLTDTPVNRARRTSGDIPINGLVTQRAGRLKPCLPMRTRYGLRGLSIASGTIYAGLARFMGMDFLKVPDTDNPGADMAQRISLAMERAGDYDFIHVHTKAPDQAAHSKAPDAKVRVIESLDRGLARSVEPLLEDESVLLAVTADHSTPSCGKLIHSGEPVPLMFIGNGVRRDAVKTFDEISVAGGCLGAMRGPELLFSILNYLDRARLVGIHDSPDPVEYWPSTHEPFILDPKPQE